MTQPRPTAEELIAAVRAFLEDDLLPTLEGRLRFHARVAVNVLDTVGRELHDGPAADDAERAGLVALLATTGGADDGNTATTGSDRTDGITDVDGIFGAVDALSRSLADRIRAGDLPLDDPDLLAHLVATARADLAIANPRHLTEPNGPT